MSADSFSLIPHSMADLQNRLSKATLNLDSTEIFSYTYQVLEYAWCGFKKCLSAARHTAEEEKICMQ